MQFAEAADAVAAYASLDATVFQGRLLHILPGNRPPPSKEVKQLTFQFGYHRLRNLWFEVTLLSFTNSIDHRG